MKIVDYLEPERLKTADGTDKPQQDAASVPLSRATYYHARRDSAIADLHDAFRAQGVRKINLGEKA